MSPPNTNITASSTTKAKSVYLLSRLHQLFVTGQFEDALQTIKQLRCMRDDFDENLCDDDYMVEALMHRHLGEVKRSLVCLNTWAQYNPANATVLKMEAKSLFVQGQWMNALRILKKSLLYAGKDWEIHHQIGLCYWKLGNNQQAVEFLKKALDIHVHESTLDALGKFYISTNDFETALQVYKEAHELAPDNSKFTILLSMLYASKGLDELASTILHDSLIAEQYTLNKAFTYGLILQRQRKQDDAQKKYKATLALCPDNPLFWNNLGVCLFNQNKLVASISCLKHAMYLSPLCWQISFNLGLCHLKTRQFLSAAIYFNQSANVCQSPEAFRMLSIAMEKLGDFESAEAASKESQRVE
ncbi:hypothetical protein HDU76_001445 [Blyttiomyces sp. JEL0837]|nr:hypothetical protein HDU76_001445 [Blyttiomyces sp. JEL0837]